MDDLAERVGRLEDERAIVATLYRYGAGLDHDNREEFLTASPPTPSTASPCDSIRRGSSGSMAMRNLASTLTVTLTPRQLSTST